MKIRVAMIAVLLGATTLPAMNAAQAAAPAARCDIDADGTADIVAGVPGADGNQPNEVDSGSIVVIPGGVDGPQSRASWKMTQDVFGVPDSNETGDRFGTTVACADLDADGFADLVVGAPGERVAGRAGAGAIHVFYGSATGFDVERSERWTPRKPGLEGDAVTGAAFGSALSIGDFDGDGYADLAVAAMGTATIHVLHSSSAGLTSRDTVIVGDAFGFAGSAFGAAMTSGDFDGDGRDDLAVGAPSAAPAGATIVVWGGPAGLETAGARVVDFAASGIRGTAKPGAALGTALAAADFDRDGRTDMAIGAPGYRYSGNDGAGVVLVLFGSRNRTGSRDRLVSSTSPTRVAAFGSALATGDFNGDGLADFAAGAPTDDGMAPYAGRVEIRYGSANTTFVDGEVLLGADLGSGFGAGIASGDVDGDAVDDLWIAAPYAEVGGVSNAGALIFAPGSVSGPAATMQIDRRTPGIPGSPHVGESFGAVDATAVAAAHPAVFLEVADRSSWTERDAVTSRLNPHSISQITIHHLGGTASTTGIARFRSAQNWHMDGHGWGDIAYHYLVGKDGRVYAARDAMWAGDTATTYDPDGHLLIVAEGNFNDEVPGAALLEALTMTVAWAVDEWDVPIDAVTGHRDHAAILCPGENLYPFLASGELAEAVSALLDAGGVWMIPGGGS